MSSGVLHDQPLVALDAFIDMRLLDGPFAHVGPLFILIRSLCVLLGMRRLPSGLPIIGELFYKVCFDIGGLYCGVSTILTQMGEISRDYSQ